ncbi:MAG: glycosyltransferase family 2 protein [Eubacteriales bacterium]|nr:glycosyltransferase family 2 protein [Eubacteriales bacterium]
MECYKISIIVPVYNVEKYLAQCVKSLMAQTWENIEIILVDDGSKDQSGVMCDRFALEDERIRVIHKENGGLISAWKRGAEEAAGEYLHFVDGDDWIEKETIEEMGAFLTGSEKEIISSDYIIEREDGKRQYVWQKLVPGEYEGKKLKEAVIPQILGNEERYVCISRCMKLISRKLILENMHYSDPVIRMGEDTTILLPAIADCERLVVMDHKAYYHYLYLETSMVHKYDSGLYENMLRLRKVVLRVIEDKFSAGEKEWMLKQAQKEHIYMMLLVLKNEARGNPGGYRKNIAAICKEPELKKMVKQYPVAVRQTANRLLYAVLKHPNAVMISLLRLAMIIYYGK